MKSEKFIFILFLLLSLNSHAKETISNDTTCKWNEKREKQHLINRQDSTTWDYEMLRRDIEDANYIDSKPFQFGVFPVPKYSLLGKNSFQGIGIGSFHRKVEYSDNSIYCTFFAVKKNELTKQYIPDDKTNEIFFTIMVLTDVEIDTVNYSHSRNQMISRNHPDYIGQGFVKTKKGEVDYAAFLTADRNEYAIVNMRLFNLKQGRMIIIAPQKDGTIRSLQLKTEQVLSIDDIESYTDDLINQKIVKDFLKSKGNI